MRTGKVLTVTVISNNKSYSGRDADAFEKGTDEGSSDTKLRGVDLLLPLQAEIIDSIKNPFGRWNLYGLEPLFDNRERQWR